MPSLVPTWSYFYQSDGTCVNAIPDEAGCEAAAIALGVDTSTHYSSAADNPDVPIGCYKVTFGTWNGYHVWNVNTGGTGCTTERNCVCRSP